ncbi:hypothetical protein DFA_08606 [Cavenderia fasciculata]|uniref:phosphatidylserine decarboxylase n=1 Tax=Cavenderia fasciculata TaxID=261658 RepID=F4Q3A0_CACFS|nr:uncharacterized protein DFA_08606 [Cavenderia fasciculata]EGG17610.1 hypothetical protein DFA_08606 [Cavenderia fasciculata]|eukprot:XP_004356094.1 hypothetical protein DFA_08606 [Cavenderia fasciculata]
MIANKTSSSLLIRSLSRGATTSVVSSNIKNSFKYCTVTTPTSSSSSSLFNNNQLVRNTNLFRSINQQQQQINQYSTESNQQQQEEKTKKSSSSSFFKKSLYVLAITTVLGGIVFYTLDETGKLKYLKRIPFRITSGLWGKMAYTELPEWAREPIYKTYSRMFGVIQDEVEKPFKEYKSMGEFFCRHLKDGARPIDQTAAMVSPVDGRIIYCGKIDEHSLEQAKGLTYSLEEFLGSSEFAKVKGKKNLYHIGIYLSPGDYHGIHSPAEWTIQDRYHFPGYLFPVAKVAVDNIRGLFALNERVVLTGQWKHGYFSLTPVGASNVGSIVTEFDKDYLTNDPNEMKYENKEFYYKSYHKSPVKQHRGEELAFFKMGSTVIMVFELPEGKSYNFDGLTPGQQVKLGQKLDFGHVGLLIDKVKRLEPIHFSERSIYHICQTVKSFDHFQLLYNKLRHRFVERLIIQYACQGGQLEIIKLLRNQTEPLKLSDIGAYHGAARGGNIKVLEYLKQERVELLSSDIHDNTPQASINSLMDCAKPYSKTVDWIFKNLVENRPPVGKQLPISVDENQGKPWGVEDCTTWKEKLDVIQRFFRHYINVDKRISSFLDNAKKRHSEEDIIRALTVYTKPTSQDVQEYYYRLTFNYLTFVGKALFNNNGIITQLATDEFNLLQNSNDVAHEKKRFRLLVAYLLEIENEVIETNPEYNIPPSKVPVYPFSPRYVLLHLVQDIDSIYIIDEMSATRSQPIDSYQKWRMVSTRDDQQGYNFTLDFYQQLYQLSEEQMESNASLIAKIMEPQSLDIQPKSPMMFKLLLEQYPQFNWAGWFKDYVYKLPFMTLETMGVLIDRQAITHNKNLGAILSYIACYQRHDMLDYLFERIPVSEIVGFAWVSLFKGTWKMLGQLRKRLPNIIRVSETWQLGKIGSLDFINSVTSQLPLSYHLQILKNAIHHRKKELVFGYPPDKLDLLSRYASDLMTNVNDPEIYEWVKKIAMEKGDGVWLPETAIMKICSSGEIEVLEHIIKKDPAVINHLKSLRLSTYQNHSVSLFLFLYNIGYQFSAKTDSNHVSALDPNSNWLSNILLKPKLIVLINYHFNIMIFQLGKN